ncbi:MAG TPA: thioredoxin family protein [Candidatus Paceibacterota bacterium]|nr:thioredoxin family protein [Candidatus Paceibacterota bacterium]
MKKITFALLVCCTVLLARAGESGWMTDAAKAQARAKAENKMVLLDFTGSDWCPWCIKLDKEVFATPEFKSYAATNLVLVEVDFPRKKQLSPSQKTANQALQQRYDVKGYPTVIILNPTGAKVGELGYQKGGAAPFIARLEKLKGK